ncbi:MAG: type 4a pilus biogenesis protein PilO [Patescibacteria group bacterium]
MGLVIQSKINLRKKIIINLFTPFAIILALIFFIILPTIKEINRINNEIEAQKINLEKKFIKGQNLKQLSKNLKEIEFELTRLDDIFINKNNELEFITTLEKIAATNKVTQKINLGNDQLIEGKTYKKVPLQLSTQGNFTNQLNYLLNLESLNYYINIKSLEIFASKAIIDNSAKEPLQMNLSVDTYWQ